MFVCYSLQRDVWRVLSAEVLQQLGEIEQRAPVCEELCNHTAGEDQERETLRGTVDREINKFSSVPYDDEN